MSAREPRYTPPPGGEPPTHDPERGVTWGPDPHGTVKEIAPEDRNRDMRPPDSTNDHWDIAPRTWPQGD